MNEYFGAEFDDFSGRKKRKARRKRRRARIKKRLKKVVKNPVVRGFAKAALSVVPGGGAAKSAISGVRKLVKSAKGGHPTARKAVALAKAARRGDRRAKEALQKAAGVDVKRDVRVTIGANTYNLSRSALR